MKTKHIDLSVILGKSQLRQAIRQSLFVPVRGRTLACMEASRFDLGKYKPGRVIGQKVPENDFAYVVWAERRKDRDGPHDVLFCYSVYNNGPFAD